MPIKPKLPDIPETERTPLVGKLLGLLEQLVQENSKQAESIQQLRDEIAILKGEKAKPKFKPSGMDKQAGSVPGADNEGQDKDSPGADEQKKRPGSEKRAKKKKSADSRDADYCPPRNSSRRLSPQPA